MAKNVKKGRVGCFGGRLKSAIARRGLKINEAPAAFGIDAPQKAATQRVSTWISGMGEPPLLALVSICRALDVSADYLLGLTDDMRRNPPQAAPAIVGNSNGGSNSINDANDANDANVAALREAIAALAEQLRRKP